MAATGIAKGFYIGGQQALDQLQELGITHILSVVNYEVPAPPDGTCHWRIDLEDSEHADLLAALTPAIHWIEMAMRQKGARVLVHCNAGTSRSVSIAIAAIMKSKKMPLDAALALVRTRCPAAAPNDGFMQQLQLFENMAWDVAEEHPDYKRWQMEQLSQQWEAEGYVDPGEFAELPDAFDEALDKLTCYRCRKCRQLLATSRNVVPTESARGHKAFRGSRRPQQPQQAAQLAEQQAAGGQESSVFVEPMRWMQDAVVGPVQGKLYCPKCNSRLGAFSWAGITTSGASWMTPAFQLQSSKIDAMLPSRPLAQLSNASFPAVLAASRSAAEGGDASADFLPDLEQAGAPSA